VVTELEISLHRIVYTPVILYETFNLTSILDCIVIHCALHRLPWIRSLTSVRTAGILKYAKTALEWGTLVSPNDRRADLSMSLYSDLNLNLILGKARQGKANATHFLSKSGLTARILADVAEPLVALTSAI
jgi:hypothetical protein